MKKWFNRVIKKLQDSDFTESGDPASQNENVANSERSNITDIKGKAGRPENSIELKERGINIIAEKSKVIAYGNIKISAIIFHTKYNATSPDGLAASAVFGNEDFKEELVRKLQKLEISVSKNFTLQVLHSSPGFENCTKISPEIVFEIIPETIVSKKINAKLSALLGYLWEREYIIESIPDRFYNIGRCKQPKLDNGYIINNDIAFIGPEEETDVKYSINANVSRAMAQIFYDKDKESFVLRKSNFLRPGDITIKVVSASPKGINTVNLRHHMTEIDLKDNDQILFNDKVSLLFNLIKDI